MDKSKIYINLSKCTEAEQKHIKTLTGIKNDSERIYLSFSPIQNVWGYFDSIGIKNKQELTYPKFCELFQDEIQTDHNGQPMTYWGGKQTSAKSAQVSISKELFIKLAKDNLIALENYQMNEFGEKPLEVFGIEKFYNELFQDEMARVKTDNEWIKYIAISHQKQMRSTHPHAIIGTIEDAIIEALETFNSNQ